MEIGVLDDDGLLIAVRAVSAGDYKTDPAAKSVALPDGHDMRRKLREYRYDYLRDTFMPASQEIDDVVERDVPGLIDALVAITEELAEKNGVGSPEHKKALRGWRETVDARRNRR